MFRKTSKDCAVDNMKKTGLNAYVCDFSVDYNAVPTVGILLIDKYLMIKSVMIKNETVQNVSVY